MILSPSTRLMGNRPQSTDGCRFSITARFWPSAGNNSAGNLAGNLLDNLLGNLLGNLAGDLVGNLVASLAEEDLARAGEVLVLAFTCAHSGSAALIADCLAGCS